MSDLFTRSRTVVLRNWRELSPKLAVGLLTGSITGAALDFAASNHVIIAPQWQHFIVVGGFFLGGYIKSETFPTLSDIARDIPKAEAVADKVIHPPLPNENTQPVTIVPKTPPLVATPENNFGALLNPRTPDPAPVSEDNKETQVLPPSAPFMGSRFGQ